LMLPLRQACCNLKSVAMASQNAAQAPVTDSAT